MKADVVSSIFSCVEMIMTVLFDQDSAFLAKERMFYQKTRAAAQFGMFVVVLGIMQNIKRIQFPQTF